MATQADLLQESAMLSAVGLDHAHTTNGPRQRPLVAVPRPPLDESLNTAILVRTRVPLLHWNWPKWTVLTSVKTPWSGRRQTNCPKKVLRRVFKRHSHQWLDCSTGLSFWAMWYKALIAFMLNRGGFLSAGELRITTQEWRRQRVADKKPRHKTKKRKRRGEGKEKGWMLLVLCPHRNMFENRFQAMPYPALCR